MTTKKILLLAGSAALLANFAVAQSTNPNDPQPPPPSVQAPPPPPQDPQPPTQWRRFGQPGSTGDPQVVPPQNVPPPPQGAYGQNQPNYGNYPPPPPPQQGYGQNQPNSGNYPPPPMAPAQMTLPAGTWVKIHTDRPLSTDHNKAGDMFTGTLAQPLIVNGFVIAHAGQTISGRVAVSNKAGRVKGTSELGLELTEVAIADGQQLNLKTAMFDHRGPTSKGDDAFAIGATTGVGAAIGGAVNGGVGAGVGAAAGLLVSTIGVLTTRGRPTVIYPEALVTFKTQEPVSFSTEKSNYAFQPASPQDYGPGMQTRTMVGPRPGYYPRPYYGYPYPYPYYPYPYFGGVYLRYGYGGYGRRW